ncbi:MAG: hypothetical protein OXT07_03210 [bacterium]|nr:hypothetical protein [bacterium]MDE0217011.1 hypothetical protein [bacterium]
MEQAKGRASPRIRLVASLLAMALLAAGCTTKTGELPQGPPREVRIINNVEVADDDHTLTVRYWGTECEEFSDSEIEYGITQIKITVYALVATEECQRSGLQQTADITLNQPLDSRIIIDANTDTVVYGP